MDTFVSLYVICKSVYRYLCLTVCHLSLCLSIPLFAFMSSVTLSIDTFVSQYVTLSIDTFVCLYVVCPSVYSYLCLTECHLSLCLSIHLSHCMSSVTLSIDTFVSLYVICHSVYRYLCLTLYVIFHSVYRYVRLIVCCLSICLSIPLFHCMSSVTLSIDNFVSLQVVCLAVCMSVLLFEIYTSIYIYQRYRFVYVKFSSFIVTDCLSRLSSRPPGYRGEEAKYYFILFGDVYFRG